MFSLVLTATLLAPGQAPHQNLFDQIVKEGLTLSGGPKVRLPRPFLSAGMTAAQKQKVVNRVAAETSIDHFADPTIRAPHYFKDDKVGDEDHPGHLLSVAFIAYGKIEDVDKRNLLDLLLGLKDKEKKKIFLPAPDLARRKIMLLPKNLAEERYAVLDSTLVDKVVLTGVMRNQTWKKKGELTSIAVLDNRFAKDKTYPNRYQRIKLNGRDEKILVGKPTPYSGFGGYTQVTELEQPAGALFIEMHFAYSEPRDWFNGKSLLLPKLKLGLKDNITTLRRSLKVAQTE